MSKQQIKKCKHGINIEKCQECRMEAAFQSKLKDVRVETSHCLGEPTYHFLVGETVFCGNNEFIIKEKIDNGTIYIGENSSGDVVVEPWFKLSQPNNNEPITNKWPVQINYLQQSIDSLHSYFYHFGLDMSADYQRGNVWAEADEVKLVKSIFDDIEIGKFCFIRRDYSFNGPLYEVLDGKQRVTAIIRFKEGRFKYNGKFFHELHPFDRYHFDGFPIVVGVTQNLTQKQKYEYFLRLNTTGKAQDISHLNYVESLLKEHK